MRNEPGVNVVSKPQPVDGMISPMIFDSANVAKCLFTKCNIVSDMKSAHAFICVMVVCGYAWSGMVFIAIALDKTSILVAVHFSMKNIYQSCDRGRGVRWSNVGVNQ